MTNGSYIILIPLYVGMQTITNEYIDRATMALIFCAAP